MTVVLLSLLVLPLHRLLLLLLLHLRDILLFLIPPLPQSTPRKRRVLYKFMLLSICSYEMQEWNGEESRRMYERAKKRRCGDDDDDDRRPTTRDEKTPRTTFQLDIFNSFFWHNRLRVSYPHSVKTVWADSIVLFVFHLLSLYRNFTSRKLDDDLSCTVAENIKFKKLKRKCER